MREGGLRCRLRCRLMCRLMGGWVGGWVGRVGTSLARLDQCRGHSPFEVLFDHTACR